MLEIMKEISVKMFVFGSSIDRFPNMLKILAEKLSMLIMKLLVLISMAEIEHNSLK